MSGDQRSNDDPDFLDDEFVVEGLSDNEPQDDLDQLLALPQPAPGPAPTTASADDAAAEELFVDHSTELTPSESFGADQAPFAENAPSNWNGAELELDDPSTTPASLTPPVDADEPLAEVALDGGEAWGEDATLGEEAGDEAYDAEPTEAEPADFLGLASDEAAEAVEDFDAAPAEAAEEFEQFAETTDAAEEFPAPVHAGPGSAGARWGIVFASAAATLALVAGAAVVVLRPQWVGIAGQQPRGVAVAKLERPHVEVELLPPAVVAVAATDVVAAAPTATPPAPVAVVTPAPQSVAAEPAVAPPAPSTVATAPVEPTKPVVTPVVAQQSTPPTPPVTAPESTPVAATTPVAAAPAPTVSWPVARGSDGASPARVRKPIGTMVRVGDDTMLGEADVDVSERRAVDGVVPGIKAFAQLRNGNFFIGSVKSVDAAQVTLRTSEGEVTLGKTELSRLTGLGSADYEALQKATDGFVRLTNSNKLVGGILSQIADDHVVLEFRSNRVILPRSAVGEVVAGPQGDGVRLGTTTEENDWVRKLAEREVAAKTAETKSSVKVDGK